MGTLWRAFRALVRRWREGPIIIDSAIVFLLVALGVGIGLGFGVIGSPREPLPPTLPNAVSVLESAPAEARVILIPGQQPLLASGTGVPSPSDSVDLFPKATIVSIAADIGLSSEPGRECADQDGVEICLETLASEPVLTLRRQP